MIKNKKRKKYTKRVIQNKLVCRDSLYKNKDLSLVILFNSDDTIYEYGFIDQNNKGYTFTEYNELVPSSLFDNLHPDIWEGEVPKYISDLNLDELFDEIKSINV